MRRIFAALAAVCMMGLTAPAQAAVITYDFTGVGIFTSTGATVTGSLSFDTMAPPTGSGRYALTSFEGAVTGGTQNGGSFSVTDGEILLRLPVIFLSPFGFVNVQATSGSGRLSLSLKDTTGSLLIDFSPPDNLHLIPLTPDAGRLFLSDLGLGLPSGTGRVFDGFHTGEEYALTNLELRATVVPLPAGGVLLITALGAAAVARRRSRA